MSESGGLWKHENNQHVPVLVCRLTSCDVHVARQNDRQPTLCDQTDDEHVAPPSLNCFSEFKEAAVAYGVCLQNGKKATVM